MPSTPSRTLALAGFFATAVVTTGACGSRTGLFGGDPLGTLPDGALPDGAVLDGPPDGAIGCTPGRFTLELATAQLMFVLEVQAVHPVG